MFWRVGLLTLASMLLIGCSIRVPASSFAAFRAAPAEIKGRLSLRCWARSCLAASSKFFTIITHTRDQFPDLCWAEAMFLRKLADLVILRLEFTLATMAVTGMTG